MTPERFREIRTAFERAMTMTAEARRDELAKLARQDAELAGEVQALLNARDAKGNIIDEPFDRAATATAADPTADGRMVGPYRLLELVGSGGMGEVWRAEQIRPVRRTVAVKLIKAGMDTAEVVRRFSLERQALAQMEHPAIAKAFSAGSTVEGRPYFAMEFVAGVPLNTYCDRNQLSLQRRLHIFLQVCDGVQHAHRKAIIHRDLKPSNVLVTEIDGKAAAKIIDFGIARAVSAEEDAQSLITRLGAVIGTPDYMSPEQASGSMGLDTRTDVYSLGVIFYELISGVLPLDLKGLPFSEILARVGQSEAPKPSTKLRNAGDEATAGRNRGVARGALSQLLRGDLDAIALKALEKDPGQRYESPSAFAADIRRHLRHEAVEARPATALYFFRKYLRRNLATVALVTSILTAVSAFAVWQTIELRRIARERDRGDRIAKFMTDMFRISDPGENRGNQVTARQILDKASAAMETELASEPETQSRMMDVMGRVYIGLGLYDRARTLSTRAVEIASRRFGRESLQAAEAMNTLGNALSRLGRTEEARSLDERVLSIRRKRLGETHPDTLKSMNNYAVDLVQAGHLNEAVDLQRKVYQGKLRVLGPNHPSTLMAMANLGDTLAQLGRLAEAAPLQREALRIRRDALGQDHPETLRSMRQLGATLYDQGRYAEAEATDRQVLQSSRKVLGPDHMETLESAVALANPVGAQGRRAEAEQLLRQALRGEIAAVGREHPEVLLTENNLAEILFSQGKRAEAIRIDREVLEIKTRLLGFENTSTLVSADHLAILLARAGAIDEAKSLAAATHSIQLRLLGETHPQSAASAYTLACIAALSHQNVEAIKLLRDALAKGLRQNTALGLRTAPEFQSLRQTAEFQELLAGLPAVAR